MRNGTVCFTFDDYGGADWLKADDLFRKFGAHVTFFVSGEITPDKLAVMRELRDRGHSVGLHSLHHRAVPDLPLERYFDEELLPQMEACRAAGLAPRGFAYPFSRRDDDTDRMLFRHFDFLRCGKSGTPAEPPPGKILLRGTGVGEKYGSASGVLCGMLEEAAREKRQINFYSHGISPGAKGVDMPTELLTILLEKAYALGMAIVSAESLFTANTKEHHE